MHKISTKYFQTQKKKGELLPMPLLVESAQLLPTDALVKKEFKKREEVAEMMAKMQAQQDSQSVRRKEALHSRVIRCEA